MIARRRDLTASDAPLAPSVRARGRSVVDRRGRDLAA
jgi:hypothetical protein